MASDAERLEIGADDPGTPDVRALLDHHLDFAHEMTPAGHVHALVVEGLASPAVTFFAHAVAER